MAVSTIDALYNGTSEKLTTSATGINVTGTAVMAGLTLGANNANSPQILFENSDGVTGDAALSTYDDASGTMLVMGSNFYINSSGSESRFNTSEESSAVMLNRNGDLNLLTGGTGATATTRLKIDSSGKVGIGTTSPDTELNIGFSGADDTNTIRVEGSNGASERYAFDIEADGENAKTNFKIGVGGGSTTTCMTLDSSGNLLVGTTSFSSITGGTGNGIALQGNGNGTLWATRTNDAEASFTRLGTNGDMVVFRKGTTGVGSISTNGSSVSYNTSSDYRLKENVVDLTGASARVNQLDVKRFNFIADETNTIVDGFLAHEVVDVVPEAVSGTKDAMKDEEYEVTPAVLDDDGNVTTEAVMGTRSVPDYQGIDQSKLVPLLTAALQEALTEIASLKTRVEALEA